MQADADIAQTVEMPLEEAEAKARVYARAYDGRYVPSVSRTLLAEIERLRAVEADLLARAAQAAAEERAKAADDSAELLVARHVRRQRDAAWAEVERMRAALAELVACTTAPQPDRGLTTRAFAAAVEAIHARKVAAINAARAVLSQAPAEHVAAQAPEAPSAPGEIA
jgi:hypothetical protein